METDGGPGLGWHDDTAGTSEYPYDGECVLPLDHAVWLCVITASALM